MKNLTTDLVASSCVSRVAAFMRAAGQPILERPADPGPEKRRARAMLISKEYVETMAGLGFHVHIARAGPKADGSAAPLYGDKSHTYELVPHAAGYNAKEAHDGTADLRVVVIGGDLECGVNGMVIQEIVDHANLKKFEKQYIIDPVTQERRVASPKECKEHGLGGYREWEGEDAGKWIKPANWEDPMPQIEAALAKMRAEGSW